jgi:hypothetical protein
VIVTLRNREAVKSQSLEIVVFFHFFPTFMFAKKCFTMDIFFCCLRREKKMMHTSSFLDVDKFLGEDKASGAELNARILNAIGVDASVDCSCGGVQQVIEALRRSSWRPADMLSDWLKWSPGFILLALAKATADKVDQASIVIPGAMVAPIILSFFLSGPPTPVTVLAMAAFENFVPLSSLAQLSCFGDLTTLCVLDVQAKTWSSHLP